MPVVGVEELPDVVRVEVRMGGAFARVRPVVAFSYRPDAQLRVRIPGT